MGQPKQTVTLVTTHESCLEFHVEDGEIIVDECYGFSVEPEEAIATLFPGWILNALDSPTN